MKSKYNNINKIGLITIIGTICLECVNFLLIPFLTRSLGTSGYGTISLFSTWVTIIIAVAGLQTTQSIAYIVNDEKKDTQGGIIASLLLCSLMSFGLVFIICLNASLIIKSSIKEQMTVIIVLLFLQASGQYVVNYASTLFTQQQTPMKQVVLSILVALSTALLSIVLVSFIHSNEKYYGRIYGFVVPYAIIGGYLALKMVLPYRKTLDIKWIKKYLPVCLPIIPHALSAVVFGQSDRVMLNSMCGNSVVGIYSYAYSIASLVSVAWSALNTFFQPFLFRYLKNNDYTELRLRTKNITTLFLVGYIVYIMIIPELAQLFSGEGFEIGIKYIPLLSLSFYINFIYVFDSNFESFCKKTKILAAGTMFVAVINIVLNFLLIPRYEILGAVIATLLSYVSLFIFHHLNAKRIAIELKTDYPYESRNTYVFIIVGILFVVLFYAIEKQLLLRYLIAGVFAFGALIRVIRKRSLF